MRHSRTSKTIIGLADVTSWSAVAILPLVLLLVLCRIEHDRRAVLARTGEQAVATVIRSVRLYKRCSVIYRFEASGKVFDGGGDCFMVDRNPVGSRLVIRFDPADPSRSIAPGAHLWPGWTMLVLLSLALVLFVGGALAWDVLENPDRAWRRRKRRRSAKPRQRA
jgi:hypothetical protein